MKKNLNLIYSIEFLILIFVIMFKFIILNVVPEYESIINIIFWLIIAIILFIKCHFYKDNNYLKGYSIKISIICILSMLIIMYGLGLITGYGHSIFSYNLITILKICTPIIVLILLQEYIRYTICRNSNEKKLPIILYTLLIIILNIITEINYTDLSSARSIFIFVCVTIISIIVNQALYSYITYNISLVPTIILEICIGIYYYVFPIYPILGDYIYSLFGVILPFVLYILNRRAIKYNDKGSLKTSKLTTILISFPLLLITVGLGILISGIFNYKLIAIGSGSMSGTYERGDAVIYKKVSEEHVKDIKVGEILVFNYQGRTITHRVVKKVIKNGIVYFNTKGDANNDVDSEITETKDVYGTVKYKIDYIGYPTVLLGEFFNK